MNLANKTVVFLGDSITAGSSATSDDKVFHAVLKRETGIKEIINLGAGGTRIARQKTPSEEAIYDNDFNLRYDENGKHGDVIFIFGGTNDFGHGDAPIGTPEDDTFYTFCGALNALLKKAINDYGKENVILITPLHRVGENNLRGEGKKPSDGEPLSEYVKAEKAVAATLGVKIIDLWNEKTLNPNDKDNLKLFADGLHPNDDGHKLLAEILKEKIASL